jgi:hypothetical protein
MSERQAIDVMREALREIAFMGSDVPIGGDEGSFNRRQFYACISTAAHALEEADALRPPTSSHSERTA